MLLRLLGSGQTRTLQAAVVLAGGEGLLLLSEPGRQGAPHLLLMSPFVRAYRHLALLGSALQND